MTDDWEWIVPFEGRGHSGATCQNFLCRASNVYVMDNHRAALWCWLQEVDLSKTHSLMHIDRHYDALRSRLDEWMQHLPSWDASIGAHLGKTYRCEDFEYPVIRWDNYLSIYLRAFGENLQTFHCLTHDDGDKPDYDRPMIGSLWDLPQNLSYWLSKREAPWIVNIDLDYFFCEMGDDYGRIVSDQYIDRVAAELKVALDRGVIGVVTLCLTPDSFTPGWEATEALAARILKPLGLTFELPDLPHEQ